MNKTKISWANYTWNPVVGCKCGCPYCYAKKIFTRFNKGKRFEDISFSRTVLNMPMPKKPARIFCNSMSDICYWHDDDMAQILDKIRANLQHRFIFLTKDPTCYYRWTFPPNCWLGITATNNNEVSTYSDYLDVWDNTFLNIEPMLEDIDVKYINNRPNWIIAGLETGRKNIFYPKPEKTIFGLINYCADNKIPLFLKDSIWNNYDVMKIQQYPAELQLKGGDK